VKDFSRIEAEYQRSDQRRFYVPCPNAAYGVAEVGAVEVGRWRPETARYQCEHCGERFEEMHKPAMLRGGEWRATAPSNGRTAGFQLSGLYSPLGWCSWEQLVDDFLRAKGDAPALKSFVNTRLAETWEEDYAAKVSADGLMARRLDYRSPAPALMAWCC
jgi:phage terminase large subunit GpA-like protein